LAAVLRLRASIGIIVAITAIAAVPGASDSIAASVIKKAHARCAARASAAKAKHAKRRARCKKRHRTAHGRKVLGHHAGELPPEAGTLIVHVYREGGAAPPYGCWGTQCPEEGRPVYVARIGPGGEILSRIETGDHTITVVAGVYAVALFESVFERGSVGPEMKTVTVGAGQTVEVTLDLLTP
jgi:hypothetical protein